MGEKARRAKLAATHAGVTPAGGSSELPERWSAQRKSELVLRLLRGGALDAVLRESQAPANELERSEPTAPNHFT